MLTRFCILVVFTLWLSVLPAAAELRQWTDENGVKHFSNKEDLPEAVFDQDQESQRGHAGR